MAHINLLPWRATARAERRKEFFIQLALAALLAAACLFYWHLFVQQQIDHQTSRNTFLKSEIAAVDKQIEEIKDLEKRRAQLIGRMNVIQNLQISRPQIVHLFDELVSTIPDGTFLVSLTQTGSAFSVDGRAQSNARVSAYMRNIDAASWMGGATLKVIESKEKTDTGLSHFSLAARQLNPNIKPEDMIAAPSSEVKADAGKPPKKQKPAPAKKK